MAKPDKLPARVMHGYVVFDNNAYKRLSQERLDRIIAAERKHRIIPLANIAVLQELLARARDVGPEQRGRNRAAIRKLGQHCRSTRAGQTVLNFLGHLESQVYRLFTGVLEPGDAQIFDQLGEIVRVVTEAGNDDPLVSISKALDLFEQNVSTVEREYVACLKEAPKVDIQPNQMKRNLDYANSAVTRTQKFYQCRFSREDIMSRIIDLAKLTSIGFMLRNSVVEEIRTKGGGHGQHGNTVWDEEVVSSTSIYTTIAGKSVLLVTEEARLLAVAAQAKAADHVCDIATYEKMLGLPIWPSA
ncbi:MAG: hypothetical protein M3P26_16100 [Gemmatimonadota bacterium]|nr:hypothetical protein [Gemmatimonadota bacterium]